MTGPAHITDAASNLKLRVLSGMAMIAMALAALWFGGWAFLALIAIVGVLACLEWLALTNAGQSLFQKLGMSAALLGLIGLGYFYGWSIGFVGVLVAGGTLLLVAAIRVDRNGFWTGLGLMFIGLPVVSLAWLRDIHEPRGFIIMLWYFLVIWGTDTAAYFAGRSIGGPKLAPRISPKKTWAGAIGGLTAAALIGFLAAQAFGLPSPFGLAAVSVFVSGLAQLSDLLESAVKRHFDKKDSGHIIPGHGGVLDRIDSLILTAPALAIALALPGAGII